MATRIETITDKINQHYFPATISDYDLLLTFQDFKNLFAPIDNYSDAELNNALNLLGFIDDSRMDNYYMIKITF